MNEPVRFRLQETRPSLTHKRTICGYECYITVSFYDDPGTQSRPAEIFMKIAKQGSMVAGLMDGALGMISLLLQYGVPWARIRKKLEHHRFGNEAGDTDNTSLYDGLAKAIDHMIQERAAIVGDLDETPVEKPAGWVAPL